jgi:DNA-binding NarL/FixJ family response regulator
MSRRILIVEDDPIISEDIATILEKEGYEIAGKAYSGLQAFDMLVNREPDLVLLDIALKGDKDGIEIAEVIRARYRIPFIYITSFSDPETLSRVKTTLPFGYIVKPFRDKDILTAIELAMFRFTEEQKKSLLSKADLESRLHVNVTKMEFRIVELIWEGQTNQAIADTLFISVNTVKSHVKNIFAKFQVGNRSELLVRLR